MSKGKTAQRKFVVSVTKKFEFPSCVIDPANRLRDLFANAWAEYVDQMMADPTRLRQSAEINLDEELPYRVPISRKEGKLVQDNGNTFDLGHVIRLIAEYLTEQKYGELNPETNPDLYEVEEEEIYGNPDEDEDEDEVVDVKVHHYMRPDVSRFYENTYEEIRKKIRSKTI